MKKKPNQNTTGSATEAAQLKVNRTKYLIEKYSDADPLLARFLRRKIERGPSITSSNYIG